jgi:hypothetical protein
MNVIQFDEKACFINLSVGYGAVWLFVLRFVIRVVFLLPVS